MIEPKQVVKELSKLKKNEDKTKYQGKGTRARLNTAAEKHIFNTKHD